MRGIPVGFAWITVVLFATGCGLGGGAASNLGATPGGVQDIGLAREMVADGIVPPPEALLVEGMFSEHDLPLDGPACEQTFCIRSALGIAQNRAEEPSAWLQLGLSSNLTPESFQRPSVTLVMTVDVSGSMGWGYGDGTTPGELSRRLLHALGEELRPGDRVAVVTYGSDVTTRLTLRSAADMGDYHALVDQLRTEGVTNMEAGLRRAYEIGRAAVASGETEEVRVLLFTDVRPNVGADSATEFSRLVDEGAASGVGITVLGLGLGLGQKVLNAMADARGGNAFSLFDGDDLDEFMAQEWPFFASPIAYDFELALSPNEGFQLAEGYGFPGRSASGPLSVATIFLSRRRGALLVRLAPDGPFDNLGATALLHYTDRTGSRIETALDAVYGGEELDGAGQYFEQHGVAKATALALLVDGMAAAASAYRNDPERAVGIMRSADARFAADARELADPALDVEVEFSRALLLLMEEGAPQSDPYGGF